MSMQCAAHAVRALAALPAPAASPRRRLSRVSLSPYQTGRAPAVLVRAADSSSPPATAPAAQSPAATAGKTTVPDDEFSLAKVSSPTVSWFLGKGMVTTPWRLSCRDKRPSLLNLLFAGVIRRDWAGRWDLATGVSSDFFNLFRLSEDALPCKLQVVNHVFLHLRYGFGSYFNLLPGSEWSALLLTYGFPLTIIGMALKARNLLYLQEGPC